MTDPDHQPESSARAEDAHHWIARLASGSISESEMARFRQWRAVPDNDRVFTMERSLWRELTAIEGAFLPTPEARRRHRFRSEAKRKMLAVGTAVAATAALAIMVTPDIGVIIRADHRTTSGEVRQITLADGSSAFLDTDSAITVNFSDGHRDIALLSGRAWFDVRHGDRRPFRVAALGGVTEDIGTAFEVDRIDDETVNVGVTEGAVKVMAAEGRDALTLTAGQHARYREGQSARRMDGDAAGATATWRNGELLVRNLPVEDALRAVLRYRGGTLVTFGDMTGLERVSGTFRTDSPDDALTTMAVMRGLRLTRLPAGVVIARPPASH